ncbi:MAG: imidazole glycerol phosphate synthase subunit HisH [Flavobacteriales bacterium]|nr:imidazole glycerol phosphate synthase subunit HisH [Flavobacteriales bacterium]
MPRTLILDYNLGNLFSVKQACAHVGIPVEIGNSKEQIESASAIILPGVGAFPEAMKNLTELGIVNILTNEVNNGKPLFGVCLGMQLLFSSSEEFGFTKGLGLIDGTVEKFSIGNNDKKLTVPQINWNRIEGESFDNTPLDSVSQLDYMYFVHSYYVNASDSADVLTTTNYGGLNYCSTVNKNNIFATQYHPEKSGEKGLEIYKKWAEINNLIYS